MKISKISVKQYHCNCKQVASLNQSLLIVQLIFQRPGRRITLETQGESGWDSSSGAYRVVMDQTRSTGTPEGELQSGGPVKGGSQGRPCPALAMSWVTEGIRMRKSDLTAQRHSPKGPGQEWAHPGPRSTGTLGWVQVSMCPLMHCWGHFVTVLQLLGKLLSHR